MGKLNVTTSYLNQQLQDSMVTPIGGRAIKFINATGSTSVKGTVVSVSDTVENGVKAQDVEFDAVGIIYEDGIANGQEVWVVVSGIAEVLLEDGTAAVPENWVQAAVTDGRALATTPPSGIGDLISGEHFKEIGHCLETKTAGTDVLCKIAMHFL